MPTVVLERAVHPRTTTCGDVLHPTALHQLRLLGLDVASLHGAQVVRGLRCRHDQRVTERNWPVGPGGDTTAVSIRRDLLDHALVTQAAAAGATVLEGHEAVAPIVERGFLRGATVRTPEGHLVEMEAAVTVVADGANSRFGRSVGTYRNRSWPYATSIRGYWQLGEPDALDDRVDMYLDVTGVDGRAVAGFGWVAPLADGTANIGLTVLSTSHGFRGLNTSVLLDSFVRRVAQHLPIDPDAAQRAPVSGRIPLGGSVGPASGPTHLVVGDAAGAANALTGAGVEYALATGRVAGRVLVESYTSGDITTLQKFPGLINDRFAQTYRRGRAAARLWSHPRVVTPTAQILAGSSAVADRVWDLALNGAARQWVD